MGCAGQLGQGHVSTQEDIDGLVGQRCPACDKSQKAHRVGSERAEHRGTLPALIEHAAKLLHEGSLFSACFRRSSSFAQMVRRPTGAPE
jgi:hypothetical protein